MVSLGKGGDDPARRATPRGLFLQDFHVLGFLSALAVVLLAWAYPLWAYAGAFLCPLRELTGVLCPTCFGTRALLAAARGDWGAALALNPMVAVAAIGLIVYMPVAAGIVVGGWPRPSLAPRTVVPLAWLGVGLVLANWLYLLTTHG